MSKKTSQEYDKIFLNDKEVTRISDFKLSDSKIRTFYKDKNVLISGVTGFVGKVLLEKLLRTCVEITEIFILLRSSKKHNTIQERLDDYFNQSIFDRLRKDQPDFRKRITPISADFEQLKIGISDEDIAKIQQKVSVFFHAAATVRFFDPLRKTVLTNIRGTDELIKIALGCPNLEAFVYFSTAYSNSHLENIEEQFYEPPMSAKSLINLVLHTNEEVLDKITPQLLGTIQNNYLYSKLVAESMIKEYGTRLPICVFRPSIVVSTYREPIRGWGDNVHGASGVAVGAGTGLIHVAYADGTKIADLVPVDMVVNASIVCAWRTAMEGIRTQDPLVYNYVSSCQKPVNWDKWQTMNRNKSIRYPTVHAIWYYSFFVTKYWYFYKLCAFFVHYLPAYIMDAISKLRGQPIRLVRIYDKVEYLTKILKKLTTSEWKYTNNNVQNLWNSLNEADKFMFYFNFDDFSWEKFTETYLFGMRIYLVKDPTSTLPEARKKWKKLKYLHFTTKYGFLLLLLWSIWSLLSYIFL